MKKLIYLGIITIVVLIMSCENQSELGIENENFFKTLNRESYNNVYTSAVFDFLAFAQEKNEISIPPDVIRDDFYYKIYTDLEIPQHISSDLEAIHNYVITNIELYDGKIEYYRNDRLVRTDNFENGNLMQSMEQDPYPKKDECSYDGIQDCVQYSIYEEMTFVEKLICSAGGLLCIMEEAAACTEKNCF